MNLRSLPAALLALALLAPLTLATPVAIPDRTLTPSSGNVLPVLACVPQERRVPDDASRPA